MAFDLKSFWRNDSGNFALIAAIGAVPLLGLVGLAADYVMIFQKQGKLQEIADSTSLAVAKEMALSNSKTLDVQSIAENFAGGLFSNSSTETLTITADREEGADNVEISLSYVWRPLFAHYVDNTVLPLNVSSQAGFAGGRSSICVLSLEASQPNALTVGSKSSITANNCAIFANSTSSTSVGLASDATMTAENILVSGGYSGSSTNYDPLPITDAPPIADPLSDRTLPLSNICDYKDVSISGGTHTLNPGIYCGGLKLNSDSIGEFEPGIYVMKDGPLIVGGNATIKGNHVGFYFTGDKSVFDFDVSTQISLSAPKTGALTGILFFEDPKAPDDRVFTIRSKDAERFEGTVYLPKGTLFIDKESKVGQLSNWTAIIAKRIDIGKGPKLVINSDYANSDVPVPEGISGKKQVRLLK